jgi:hypothetical protein
MGQSRGAIHKTSSPSMYCRPQDVLGIADAHRCICKKNDEKRISSRHQGRTNWRSLAIYIEKLLLTRNLGVALSSISKVPEPPLHQPQVLLPDSSRSRERLVMATAQGCAGFGRTPSILQDTKNPFSTRADKLFEHKSARHVDRSVVLS